MSELSIVLSGEIEQSNFDEWKTELIEQIRSVKTELVSDEDFAAASKHVKQFKAAEKSLKAAKKSALEQASEISKLFDAIDTVTEEARQARLTLDKQIKKRKQEIKNDFIDQGVASMTAFIAEQSDAFQTIAHDKYTDKDIFADAISGKASTKGMQKAITKTCKQIKEAVTQKAAEVNANAETLDNLPQNQQALFQDRKSLLDLTVDQLNKTIDERIAKLSLNQEQSDSEAAVTAPAEDDADGDHEEVAVANTDLSDYTITIEIHSTEQQADDIRSHIVKQLKANTSIGNITLSAD